MDIDLKKIFGTATLQSVVAEVVPANTLSADIVKLKKDFHVATDNQLITSLVADINTKRLMISELQLTVNELESNVNTIQNQLTARTSEMESLRQLLDDSEADMNSILERRIHEILELNDAVATHQQSIETLNDANQLLRMQLTARTSEMESLKQLLDDQQAAINENAILKSRIKYLERLLD